MQVNITIIDARKAVLAVNYLVFKTNKFDNSTIFQEPGGMEIVILLT